MKSLMHRLGDATQRKREKKQHTNTKCNTKKQRNIFQNKEKKHENNIYCHKTKKHVNKNRKA